MRAPMTFVVLIVWLGCDPRSAPPPPAASRVEAPEPASEPTDEAPDPPDALDDPGTPTPTAAAQARYHEGLRLRGQDPTAAAQRFEEACDGDVVDACLAFAEMLESGSGIDADPERARGLLEEACMAGSTSACDQLGH